MDSETQVIAMVSGLFIPLLVGILAKLAAPTWLKAFLNFGLTAATGALATIVPDDSPGFAWTPFLIAWLSAWVVSVATHYGLWKPTGTTLAVQQATADVGLGPVQRPSP